jgi:hypothetical protein
MKQKGDLAMGRSKRPWVSQLVGSFHIISRVAGGTGSDFILQYQEKEYFLKLLERFASGFFVKVHAFAIMSNHFHILATGMELKAKQGVGSGILFTPGLCGLYAAGIELIWKRLDGSFGKMQKGTRTCDRQL